VEPGFIGSALLQRLGKVRPRSVLRVIDLEHPSAPHDEFVHGNILDQSVVSRAVAGCTEVLGDGRFPTLSILNAYNHTLVDLVYQRRKHVSGDSQFAG
jgi:nucleoside-diphosphate-sugar epimerase